MVVLEPSETIAKSRGKVRKDKCVKKKKRCRWKEIATADKEPQ